MTRPLWLRDPRLNGRALEFWELHAPDAYRSGHLTRQNVEQFRSLARLLALAEQAAQEIEAAGVSVRTGSGAIRPNPACNILLAAQKAAEPLLAEFGFVKMKGPWD
jgi:hypothetical protein